MMRTTTLAITLATVLLAGCGRDHLPTVAAARSASASQAAAAAYSAAEREAVSNRPLSAAEAGLPGGLGAADQDRDGSLAPAEQRLVARQIAEAMAALAEAQAPQGPLEPSPLGKPSAPYAPEHSTEYRPVTAEAYADAHEIIPAVHQALASAQRRIQLDLFLLGGAQGQRLAEILVAKRAAGVEVKLIHDPGFGLAGTARQQILPVVRHLLAHGVEIKPYPLQHLQRRGGHPFANRFQIDHNKFIVIDDRTAFVGTFNLIDVGAMNHDVFMRVDGAPAQELSRLHEATWALPGASVEAVLGKALIAPAVPPTRALLQAPAAPIAAVGPGVGRVTKTDVEIQDTKQRLLEAFQQAKQRIDVAIFEFGDVDVAEALVAAKKRGVDVRVLADRNANYGKYLDAFKNLKLYGTPNLRTMNILREGGVPAKWFKPETTDQELHMKLAIVDGQRVLVGSTNFTYQAFRTFRETNLDVLAEAPAAKLVAMFNEDWESRGIPVTKPTFYEKSIIAAVKAFDALHLSWW